MKLFGICNRTRMNNIRPQLLILFLASTLLTSCLKEGFDPEAQLELEKPIIEDYVNNHIPEAIQHENTGIWYVILEEAEEGHEPYEYTIHPTAGYINSPDVTINYRGVLLNGTEFDSGNDKRFNLGGLIIAWQMIFLPSEIGDRQIGGILNQGLQKGMKVRLVTPSLYAYGEHAQGNIPANSPLDFTIEVLDIEDPQSN